ncbi:MULTISPECIES: hypothetical protein [unclassified Streptomyces]|uniref:hypothetical protein n=1 Tax=unclassified Streptomyces TaxID=2593676 RepID=UPI002E79DA56|nr:MULTISPECIES: hypothetical protein [unclassified Streptomyces]MEE1758126.1 hypothetical protein [Streptomyces sp. SP18BB07]MEE1832262.1 hypothetical protein [Streptomyces sp. SP17KL33]
MAALLVTACSTLEQQRSHGSALEGGIQESGTVGSENVKVGDTWWFALPVPTNKSAEPIEITGVSLVQVPKGMKVLGYGAYSLEDTEGLALLAKEGEELTPRFAALRDHSDKPVKVAPHTSSDIYYLARLKITSLPSRSARYCEFDYRQGGRAYTQTLDCEVELTGK